MQLIYTKGHKNNNNNNYTFVIHKVVHSCLDICAIKILHLPEALQDERDKYL